MLPKQLTTGDVAKYCHVTHVGVLKWIKAGKLKAYRTPGGHYRVQIDDFRKFLDEYNMPIDEKFFTTNFKKILIVDDDPSTIEYLQTTLDLSGRNYQISNSTDGYDACLKVGLFNPDLLILDIRMPNVDGFEVCSNIKNNPRTKDTKILIVSGYPEEEVKVKEMMKKLTGISGFLVKPIDPYDFIQKVNAILG